MITARLEAKIVQHAAHVVILAMKGTPTDWTVPDVECQRMARGYVAKMCAAMGVDPGMVVVKLPPLRVIEGNPNPPTVGYRGYAALVADPEQLAFGDVDPLYGHSVLSDPRFVEAQRVRTNWFRYVLENTK